MDPVRPLDLAVSRDAPAAPDDHFRHSGHSGLSGHSSGPPRRSPPPQDASGARGRRTHQAPGQGRAGFVGIVGRPNVGKSTLLNRIIGEKLAIASPRPQTTRNRILAVHNIDSDQLVLVDTPGLHRPHGHGRSGLNTFMMDEARRALTDVDVALVLTDLRALGVRGPGQAPTKEDAAEFALGAEEQYVAQELAQAGKPTVLAVNKIDLLGDKRRLLPLMESWSRLHPLLAIVPVSALTGEGVDALLRELRAALPAGPPLFPEDVLTDRPERWLVAELIREQVFLKTRQEVPYAVAVTVETWQDRPGRRGGRAGVNLDATIHVEKESQKKIIVGEGGAMIRDIGTAARAEIERLLSCPVHVALFVRVDPDWTTRPAALREMGYASEKPAPARRADAGTARGRR